MPTGFATHLRRLRVDAGLTRDLLAGLSGVSERTIERLEKGETIGQVGTVELLAEALAAPTELLLELRETAINGRARAARRRTLPGEVTRLGRYAGVHDADFVMVGTTDELSALLGYRRRQMKGMSAWDFGNEPTGPEQQQELMEALAVHGYIGGVAALRHRDRSTVRFRFVTRAMNGGEFYVTTGEPV